MMIERQQMEEFHRLVAATRLGPSGLRLQRLLRELPYLESSLVGRFLRVWGTPLVTVVLAAVVLLVVVGSNLVSAQSASVPAVAAPVAVAISTDQAAASERQAQAYTSWLREAHAQAAVQGDAGLEPETF